MKLLAIACGMFALPLAANFASGQITTSQYHNQRTGATLTETVLTPRNVNVRQFGKLGAFKVDGAVFAQPLFVPALEIPGKAGITSSSLPPSTTACMPLMQIVRTSHPFGR